VSLIAPEVIAGWSAFSEPLEGRFSHAYRDVRGLVTVGVRNLIDPFRLASGLPWKHLDGTPATPDEVAADWHRVKALPAAMLAGRYAGSHPLVLSDDVIDELVLRQLLANAGTLVVFFPDFASYPAPAQQALLSLAWALGAGFPPSWPRLSAAVRQRVWKEAAEECAISTEGNAGVEPRNRATKRLFIRAAAGA